MRYYCTYFDKNYLVRGLVLYRSMLKHCRPFTLYILCFDRESYDLLTKMKLAYVKLIRLEDFEDDQLRSVKGSRSKVEYYWTCTPSLLLYIFNREGINMLTYLDADLMFFSSPEPIFKELGDNSILVIEHRFVNDLEENIKSRGKYNVQFLTFRDDKNGQACLKWWRERCIEWCFNRHENGLIGDQGYLNEWEKLFDGVYSLKNLGGGLAPWNINAFNLRLKNGKIFVEGDELMFYHYHSLKIFKFFFIIDPAFGYKFTEAQMKMIYLPYFKELRLAFCDIRKIDPSFNFGFSPGGLKFLLAKLILSVMK